MQKTVYFLAITFCNILFFVLKIQILATSNGSTEGINNTRLGLCVTANMRLRIDVRPLSDHFYPNPEEGNGLNAMIVSEQTLKPKKSTLNLN